MLRVVVMAAVGALAGCSHLPNWHLGTVDHTTPRLGLLFPRWHREMVDPLTIDWRPVNRGSPAYDAQRDIVYVGSADNGLYAIRASDGQSLWRFQTFGRVESSPAIVGDLVVFGSADGALYAIDKVSGQMRWRLPRRRSWSVCRSSSTTSCTS